VFLHGLSLDRGQQIEGKIINQENNKEPVKSRKIAFQDRLRKVKNMVTVHGFRVHRFIYQGSEVQSSGLVKGNKKATLNPEPLNL